MFSERIPHRLKTGCTLAPCILAVGALLLITQPSVGHAGMVLEEKTEIVGVMKGQGAGDSRMRESTTYLEGKKIRTETEGRVWVLDFDKGMLITINPSSKTYSEMSLQELKVAQKRAMEWMGNLRAQMEERMKTMPPEQQEAMRKKLESFPRGMSAEEEPAKITVKLTTEKRKINGFDCQAYDVFEDGERTTRFWLTSSVSTAAFDTYQEELNKWLEGMGPLGANRLREWDHIRGKGFPIKVERLKPILGKVAFNREILKVEEKSLSESLFQPPKDFKRTEAPSLPNFGAQPGTSSKPK